MCLRRLHQVSADDATTFGWVNSISAFLHILISAVTATAASCSASRPWPWRTRIYTSVLPTARGETLISGTVRSALAHRARGGAPGRRRGEPARRQTGVGPCWTAPLAFWDLQRGNYPRYVADVLIAERLQPALARLRAASTNRRPVAVAAYTSRPRTTEAVTVSAPPAIPT